MKKLLLTLLILTALYQISSAQTLRARALNPNVYRTNADLKVKRITDKNFVNTKNENYILKIADPDQDIQWIDYRIVKEDDNGMIIKILPWAEILRGNIDKNTGLKTIKIYRDEEPNRREDSLKAHKFYFYVANSDIGPLNKVQMSSKIVGMPLIHPFKIRPNTANLGPVLLTEFTISYTLGIRFKLGNNPFKQNYFSLIPYGLGVGSAKYKVKDSSEEKDGAAITYYQGGGLFTFNKVNIGAFIGFDAMIGKQNDWVYQSKPWFSLGFGYKFKED